MYIGIWQNIASVTGAPTQKAVAIGRLQAEKHVAKSITRI